MAKFLKKALSINQKWYLTLVLAILINTWWNFYNSKKSQKQDYRITEVEVENLSLKKTNVELLSKNFSGQRILDEIPFSIWYKRLSKGSFKMRYINNTGKAQFLKDRNIDRYYYFDKPDSLIFGYEDAYKFFKEDSIVAYAKSDTVAHFDTDFYNAVGKKIIKDGYTRWRKIEGGDTLVWGKMDKHFKYIK